MKHTLKVTAAFVEWLAFNAKKTIQVNAVRVAEFAGWLAFVDNNVVSSFLSANIGWKREPLFKRPLDILLSSIMLLLSAPTWLLIAIAIKLEDGGPVFYRQWRWGRFGKKFMVFKFRTMIPDADKNFGLKQAKENDQCNTRVGRILHAYGMDELPQIINILRGEMSFVGPRALAVGEFIFDKNGLRVEYEKTPGFHRRQVARPGLTSLAMIYIPKDSPAHRKFRYDLYYIRKLSFGVDLRLIALSFWISFRGKWETRQRKALSVDQEGQTVLVQKWLVDRNRRKSNQLRYRSDPAV